MTIFSSAAPPSRVHPARHQQRQPHSLLAFVALPVLLSLSFVSYLYLYQLPATPTVKSVLASEDLDLAAMSKHVDITIIGGGLAGAASLSWIVLGSAVV